jgi:hypothetical protein
MHSFVALGGLIVKSLATGLKIRDSCSAEDDGFLRAIRIRSKTLFGGEEKPSVPCRKILLQVKVPCGVLKQY